MSDSESVISSARLGYGAVAGVLAFVLNYVVAFSLWSATSFPETYEGVASELVTGQVADWVFAGWLLYGAQFVDIVATLSAGPASAEVAVNAVDIVGQSSTDILYVTVPALLVVAGVGLARSHGAQSLSDGAITGAAAAIGYFPLVAAGVFVFATEGSLGTAQPAFAEAVLIAGVIYPTVFGALGGVFAMLID